MTQAQPQAQAQAWPTRPVTIVSPFPAGTTVDVLMRLYTPTLAATFGQSFIVENRVGVAGNLAAEYVARATPDGYRLLAAAASIPSSLSLYKNLKYDFVRDLKPIAMLGSSPFFLVVSPKLGVNSVADVIKLAKSEPGVLTFASTGIGGTNHLAGELFNSMAGVKIRHIPYKDTGTALPAVATGEVSMMFAALGQVQSLVKAGRLKVLAISGAKRTPLAPDVPTISESGLAGYEALTWFALLAPAGTPQNVIDRLNAAVAKFAHAPAAQASFAVQGIDPADGTPPEVADFIKRDVDKWAKVVKDAGVQPF